MKGTKTNTTKPINSYKYTYFYVIKSGQLSLIYQRKPWHLKPTLPEDDCKMVHNMLL